MERKLIAAAVSSALAVPMAAQAVEFETSGHINRAVILVDGHADYEDNKLNHVDSNASETRFRFRGSEDIGNGTTAGVYLELGRPTDWRTRHAAVNLSGAFGTVTAGHTAPAADGIAFAYLGGPSWLAGVTNWCSYVSAGPACPSNSGSRQGVLRYDTPAIGAAKLSASVGNNEYWDAKLTAAGSFGDGGYDVRVGYMGETDTVTPEEPGTPGFWDHKGDEDDEDGGHVWIPPSDPIPAVTVEGGDILTASAAVAFGQGTSVAVAWSQENTDDETEYMFAALDHQYSADGSIGVYWKQADNILGQDDDGNDIENEGTLWGIGVGHNIGAGATAYAGYRRMEGDNLAEDVDLIIAGMRVTFN